jgi:hypothetical protein
MDFLHHEVFSQPHKLVDYTTTREFRELIELTTPRPRSELLVYWEYQLLHPCLYLRPRQEFLLAALRLQPEGGSIIL